MATKPPTALGATSQNAVCRASSPCEKSPPPTDSRVRSRPRRIRTTRAPRALKKVASLPVPARCGHGEATPHRAGTVTHATIRSFARHSHPLGGRSRRAILQPFLAGVVRVAAAPGGTTGMADATGRAVVTRASHRATGTLERRVANQAAAERPHADGAGATPTDGSPEGRAARHRPAASDAGSSAKDGAPPGLGNAGGEPAGGPYGGGQAEVRQRTPAGGLGTRPGWSRAAVASSPLRGRLQSRAGRQDNG